MYEAELALPKTNNRTRGEQSFDAVVIATLKLSVRA